MKKWFKLFAALCLAAVLCVPLAACEWGSETGGSENGGSENGGNSGDPSAVRTTVTEEEWNTAVYGDLVNTDINDFLYDPEANVTVVTIVSQTSQNGEVVKGRLEYQVDGNKVYVYSKLNIEGFSGSESEEWTTEGYAEIMSYPEGGEGVIVANVYSKDDNGQWTVAEDEFSLETDGEIDFVNEDVKKVYAYENFTYNASLRQYEARGLEFDLGEESEMSLTIGFMMFQFENGKCVCFEAEAKREADSIVTSVRDARQFESGRLVRLERQIEQNAENWSYSAVSSMTYFYGTASVTLPVVEE